MLLIFFNVISDYSIGNDNDCTSTGYISNSDKNGNNDKFIWTNCHINNDNDHENWKWCASQPYNNNDKFFFFYD